MTINIDSDSFNVLGNVNPGPGLTYFYYRGSVDDSYNVDVGGLGPNNPYYFVFALQSADWNNPDTIVSELPGTFEAGTAMICSTPEASSSN
jgi:hypothetical protein